MYKDGQAARTAPDMEDHTWHSILLKTSTNSMENIQWVFIRNRSLPASLGLRGSRQPHKTGLNTHIRERLETVKTTSADALSKQVSVQFVEYMARKGDNDHRQNLPREHHSVVIGTQILHQWVPGWIHLGTGHQGVRRELFNPTDRVSFSGAVA